MGRRRRGPPQRDERADALPQRPRSGNQLLDPERYPLLGEGSATNKGLALALDIGKSWWAPNVCGENQSPKLELRVKKRRCYSVARNCQIWTCAVSDVIDATALASTASCPRLQSHPLPLVALSERGVTLFDSLLYVTVSTRCLLIYDPETRWRRRRRTSPTTPAPRMERETGKGRTKRLVDQINIFLQTTRVSRYQRAAPVNSPSTLSMPRPFHLPPVAYSNRVSPQPHSSQPFLTSSQSTYQHHAATTDLPGIDLRARVSELAFDECSIANIQLASPHALPLRDLPPPRSYGYSRYAEGRPMTCAHAQIRSALECIRLVQSSNTPTRSAFDDLLPSYGQQTSPLIFL